MKTTTIQPIVLILLSLATGTALRAQTENTSERLITQLKNGTAPGLQFSTEKPIPALALNNKLNEKESLIAQIRKGTATGMQFKPITGGSTPVMARAATVVAPKQPLPSEQSASAVQTKVTAAPVLPKQE